MRENIKIQLLQNMLEEVTKKYDYFISQQNEKIQKTFDMAVRDTLTNLYNRQYLDEYSKQALARVQRHENTLVLIFIDLDNFKAVNDTYGHNAGDEVLIKVSKIFQKTFRQYDIIVRYGGDEFIVLIENKYYDERNLYDILEKFVIRLELGLAKFSVSASYGCSFAPKEATEIDKLIAIADERMYIQKQAKKAKR